MTQLLTADRRTLPSVAPRSAAAVIGPPALAIAALLLAGPLPMLIKLGRSLWDREQYQFFPLMIAGAALVAWDRWQDLPGRSSLRRGSPGVVAALLAGAMAVLVASALLWVRSLSLVSTLMILSAIAWHVGGGRVMRAMVPSLALLAICIPPPRVQEQLLTLRLQHLAVGLSCRLLDLLHVANVQAGNVIEIPGRRLLVEQACSGINSLMAVLAFSLLYGFYLRRSIGRLAVLLPVALLFVIGGNLARITVEAWLWTDHHVDVTGGFAHQMLGMILFGSCVSLVASFDALLGGSGDDGGGAVAAKTAPASPATRSFPGWPAWAAAVAFVAAGVWVESRVHRAWLPSNLPETATFELPPTLVGWERVTAGAAVVERPQTEAAKSFVWQYRRGDTFASVAFDYPFVGYHELVICYSVSGWAVHSETPDAAAGFNRVTMDKSAGDGYLLFSQSDEAGHPVTSTIVTNMGTFWSRLRTNLAISRKTALSGPSYQVQALMQSPGPPTAEQRRAADELFRAARAQLTKQLLAQDGGER
jgi:exosortase